MESRLNNDNYVAADDDVNNDIAYINQMAKAKRIKSNQNKTENVWKNAFEERLKERQRWQDNLEQKVGQILRHKSNNNNNQ